MDSNKRRWFDLKILFNFGIALKATLLSVNEPTAVVGYKSLILESLEYKSRHAVNCLNIAVDLWR